MDHDSPTRQLRILLVDDHSLVRHELRRILEDHGAFVVVGEAGTAHEALAQFDQHQPDLVLLDRHLPGVTGLQLTGLLKRRRRAPKIIMLSMSTDEQHVRAALKAGADAYVAKWSSIDELLATLHRVSTTPRAASPSRGGTSLPLSKREIEILDCMARGLSNREIADALFISEQTVKNHMTRMFHKLQVRDRLQAVLCAIRHGWVELDLPSNGRSAA